MREIPEDVRQAADTALLQANVKAHMLGEPTDPLECIGLAILTERERCADVARKHFDLRSASQAIAAGHQIANAIMAGEA